jgi:hypothetical protein
MHKSGWLEVTVVRQGRWQEQTMVMRAKTEKGLRTGRRVDGAAGSDSSSCQSGERESTQKKKGKGETGLICLVLNETRCGNIYTQGEMLWHKDPGMVLPVTAWHHKRRLAMF